MSGLLKGKFCIITGGGRGIGSAIAEKFAEEGASLALVARTKSQLDQVGETCKQKGAAAVETHSVDLSDSASIDSLVSGLLSKHGAIDVLVNNAGMMTGPGDPLNGDVASWDKMLRINLHAPMQLTRLVAPGMVEKKQGIIINMGSVAGVEPMQSACAYAATKWGLRGWSLSCYQNLRKHGIKVCLINPGMVNSPAQKDTKLDKSLMVQPEDIAEAVMLAVRTKRSCTPQELTIRPTEPVTT